MRDLIPCKLFITDNFLVEGHVSHCNLEKSRYGIGHIFKDAKELGLSLELSEIH